MVEEEKAVAAVAAVAAAVDGSTETATTTATYLTNFRLYSLFTENSTLPMNWQISMNYIIFVAVTVMLFSTIFIWKRPLPAPLPEKILRSWAFYCLKVVLVINTCFYFAELLFSKMITHFTPMALHHVFALAIFALLVLEPNLISVAFFVPFFLHALYWVLGAESMMLLMFYNWTLLFCGILGLFQNVVLGRPRRPISHMTPIIVISLSWSNYFIYCNGYGGYYCIRTFPMLIQWHENTMWGWVFWALTLILTRTLAKLYFAKFGRGWFDANAAAVSTSRPGAAGLLFGRSKSEEDEDEDYDKDHGYPTTTVSLSSTPSSPASTMSPVSPTSSVSSFMESLRWGNRRGAWTRVAISDTGETA